MKTIFAAAASILLLGCSADTDETELADAPEPEASAGAEPEADTAEVEPVAEAAPETIEFSGTVDGISLDVEEAPVTFTADDGRKLVLMPAPDAVDMVADKVGYVGAEATFVCDTVETPLGEGYVGYEGCRLK